MVCKERNKLIRGCIVTIFLIAGIICNAQSNAIKSFRITYIDYDIETPWSISCSDFYDQFDKEKKIWQPSDKRILDSIGMYLSNFELSEWSFSDTRAYMKWEQKVSPITYALINLGFLRC